MANPVTPEKATPDNPFLCVLDPETWLRGEGINLSYLLRHTDGKMCCMGQLASQLGIDPDELRSISAIETVDHTNRLLGEFELGEPTRVYCLNDLGHPFDNGKIEDISDAERVKRINEELQTQRLSFRFALPEVK